MAQEIDLGLVLKLGRSEMITGGRRKNAVLGDAMEAVLAAIYLDGGFQAAKDIILRLWDRRISNVDLDARRRNSSLYLIDQYVPMLPKDILRKSKSSYKIKYQKLLVQQ